MAKKDKKPAKAIKKSTKTTASTKSKPAKADSKAISAKKSSADKVKLSKKAGKPSVKAVQKIVEDKKVKGPSPKELAGDKLAKKPAPIPAVAAKVKKPAKKSNEFDDMDDGLELEDEAVQTENFKNKTHAEIEEIRALLGEVGVEDSDEVEIALRDAEGRLYCKVRECDELSVVDGYCRLHYLKFWKRIQLRKKILTDGKLEKYIDELTQRYPDKYIEMLREDLKSEKSFLSAINELEIEEAGEENADMDDDQQGLIDEVRGIQPASSSSANDDDDGF